MLERYKNAGLSLEVVTYSSKGNAHYRLRTPGVESKAAAQSLQRQIKEKYSIEDTWINKVLAFPANFILQAPQLSRAEKERYIEQMMTAVQKSWKVPRNSKFTDPLVSLELVPNGDVKSVKIIESSGNEEVDRSLIRAIRVTAPFEVPRRYFEFFRVNRLLFHPLRVVEKPQLVPGF